MDANFFKKNQLVIIGVVVVILAAIGVVVFLNPFNFGGSTSGAGIESQVAQRINAGAAVNSKAEATESLVSLSKELEKVNGSISEINENLEKNAGAATAQPPTGLLVIGETFLTVLVLLGVIVGVFFLSKKLGSQ